jgi:cellulose synthase/poly-beta-1,6-N-acetylglucosamine synthase-like glycosyltransferase
MEQIPDHVRWFLEAHEDFFIWLSWSILSVGLIQNFIYALQLPVAWLELRKHSQSGDTESEWQLLLSDVTLPISLVVPAYNEEQTIVPNVHSMLSLRYPSFEIIVVNDGSKDKTLETLIAAFSLKPVSRAHELRIDHAPVRGLYASPVYPNLLVVDKVNGKGKADASNAGLTFARNPLFCIVDADSLLEGEALLRSIRPFMEDPDMVAVGGTIRILNGCKVERGQVTEVRLPHNFYALVQSLEYIRAFLMSRLAWSSWGMLSIVSGAFGIFRREQAVEAGGFCKDTVGEDYELVIRLHRRMRDKKSRYSMRYVPEPVCWTEAPETFKILESQRKRWQRGALDVFFRHKDMLFNPRYGRMGMLAFPHNFLIDVIGPLAEGIGYILIPVFWIAGILNAEFMLAWMAVFFLFGVFISIGSLVLEEMELRRVPRARDLIILAGLAVVENFGYRQLNNLWRIKGWWEYVRKRKDWGEMVRKGAAQ